MVNLTNVSVNDTNPSVYSSSIFDGIPPATTPSGIYGRPGSQTPTGPTSANGQTTYTYSDAGHSMVFRNGGMIQSFVPPNYYFLPTAGATPTSYVNGAVLYYQSKCWSGGAQQTESVGWLDQYPTLSTESFSFNHFGGCGFPITIDMTAAASVLSNRQPHPRARSSAQHFSGYASGTYASVPAFVAGTGAGTSPTIAANANNRMTFRIISVTTGSLTGGERGYHCHRHLWDRLRDVGEVWPVAGECRGIGAQRGGQGLCPGGLEHCLRDQLGHDGFGGSTLYTWGYTCTQ